MVKTVVKGVCKVGALWIGSKVRLDLMYATTVLVAVSSEGFGLVFLVALF